MIDAKMPDNLPQWMKDHVDRYLKSGGKDGHMYTINLPNQPSGTVPSLLLVTKGRKSGEKYLFPLFYGEAGKGYFVVASKGGAPEHPGWYKNIWQSRSRGPGRHQDAEGQGPHRHRAPSGQSSGTQAVVFWPPYADYQKKAGSREIPVVVLDPVK